MESFSFVTRVQARPTSTASFGCFYAFQSVLWLQGTKKSRGVGIGSVKSVLEKPTELLLPYHPRSPIFFPASCHALCTQQCPHASSTHTELSNTVLFLTRGRFS